MDDLKKLYEASGAQPAGRFVLGMVKGSPHHIARNLVAGTLAQTTV